MLENASTENHSELRSMSHVATSAVGEKAEDRAADAADSSSTDATTPEIAMTIGSDGERSQETTVATTANSSAISDAPPSSELISTNASATTQLYSKGYLAPSVVEASVSDASHGKSELEGANAQSTSSAVVRGSGKQDRTKAQVDMKSTGLQTTALVAGADSSRVPTVTLVSWQGTAQGKGNETAESSIKIATSEDAAGLHGKTAAPVEGSVDGTASAAIVPSGTAGSEQSIMQTLGEMSEAGLDLSRMSATVGGSELTNHADVGPPATISMQKGTTAVDDSANTKAAEGASNTKGSAPGAADTSSHAVRDSETTQSSQGDASKVVAGLIVSKANDNSAAMASTQTSLTPAASHDGATLQHVAAGTADTAHASKAQDLAASAQLAGNDAAGSSGVNSAKLIQTMGETEMHVGMHSEEFGDISIRTSLSQQQMVTQISLDHNDLSQAISSHLSTMQTKLGEEYGLHASIEINNQGAPLSGGQGNSSQRDQQNYGRSSSGKDVTTASLTESVSSVVAQSSAGSGHGLDVTV